MQAWDNILNVSFLVELAQRFGVSAHHQYFNLQGGDKSSDQASALRKYGDARRSLTEHQVDIREFTRKLSDR